MKKIIIGSLCGLFVVVSAVSIKANSQHGSNIQMDTELFPSKTISEEKEDNLYVELNNKMITAMNDYEEKRISSDEYEKICEEIKEEISNNYLGRVDGDKYINYTDEVIRDIIIHVKNGNYKKIREYSSKNTGTANKFNGVYTRYRGYYIKTTKGGCTK